MASKPIAYTTKKPTGLSIKRSTNHICISWKIGDKDYRDGQTLQYRVQQGKWHTVSGVHWGTTSKTLTFNMSNFYPNTKKRITRIYFRIRGKRRDFTTGEGAAAKSYTTTVSPWAEKDYDVLVPNKPNLSSALDSNNNNLTTFTWSVTAANDSNRWFSRVQCQTCLKREYTGTDGSKITSGWSAYDASASSGSASITEDSSVVNRGVSYTRWFRVRSRGPQGNSAWNYSRHVYAMPYQTKNVQASAKQTAAGGYVCTATWGIKQDPAHPVDSIQVQYCFATPLVGMNCPDGVSWTDAQTLKYKDGTDAAAFSIDGVVGLDQCLYVRINTIHDRNTTYGKAVRAATGKLSPPTDFSVTPDISDYTVTVSATNASATGSAFLLIKYYSTKYPKGANIGVVPHGSSEPVEIKCPAWKDNANVRFGIRAVIGTRTRTTRDDGTSSYAITNVKAMSDIVYSTEYGGSVPKAPTAVTLAAGTEGTIAVSFNNPWKASTGAELSWADHEDAWTSTDQPKTFTINDKHVSAWNIGGLTMGKTWYVRVRLFSDSSGETVYSEYSKIQSIDLSSTPTVPVLSLSASVITNTGTAKASWTFESPDGTAQSKAIIARVNGNSYVTLGNVKSQKRFTLNAARLGWHIGDVYNIAVRVVSKSGKESDWSDPVPIYVADELSIGLTCPSLTQQTITVDGIDRTAMALSAMPITATVTGAGIGGTTRLVIERAETYHITRPDERDFNGYEGETIAIHTQTGEAAITIDNDDLIGALDDGAKYRLIATIQDGIGQRDEITQDFEVHWSHQAVIPEAQVVMDQTAMVAKLTPIAPTGAAETDVCDIYRLSVDRPELIYPGATFGTTYVDPYPTIGPNGGHRFVTRTANGDFITADDELAWTDTAEPEGDILHSESNIIDFGNGRVELAYNVDLSNKWDKDFTETKYLGGSVQGDWNPAVSRSGTLSAVVLASDTETIESFRRLAVYPGICHVRTKDGSSYPADVQVSESYSQDNAHKIVAFELTITRVDTEDFDGMTLTEWELEGEND